MLGARDHVGLGVFDAHPVEKVGVDDHAIARFRLTAHRRVGFGHIFRHHAGNRQVIFGREFKVALVMPRNAHDSAGAVIHQHEVRDEDGHWRARERVFGGDGGVKAQLFRRLKLGSGGSAFLAFLDKRHDRRIIGEALRDRVIGGDGAKTRAEDRIGTRRVNRQLFPV